MFFIRDYHSLVVDSVVGFWFRFRLLFSRFHLSSKLLTY